MGLVKTRRLAAMHPPSHFVLRRTRKQQRAKAGMRPPVNRTARVMPQPLSPRFEKTVGVSTAVSPGRGRE